MCGRFTLRASPHLIEEVFGLFEGLPTELPPRFNIAPTQFVVALRQTDAAAKPAYCSLRWGLIPSWADDASIANRLINARAEGIADKPSFRAAFKRRRCLILADGFYEWQSAAKSAAHSAPSPLRAPGGESRGEGDQNPSRELDLFATEVTLADASSSLGADQPLAKPKAKKGALPKQPFHMHFADHRPFAFAGLWEHWENGDAPLDTCTIITTTANAAMQPLHDRMPVILAPGDYARWLSSEPNDPALILELLRPCPDEWLTREPVSTSVNNPRREGPECLQKP